MQRCWWIWSPYHVREQVDSWQQQWVSEWLCVCMRACLIYCYFYGVRMCSWMLLSPEPLLCEQAYSCVEVFIGIYKLSFIHSFSHWPTKLAPGTDAWPYAPLNWSLSIICPFSWDWDRWFERSCHHLPAASQAKLKRSTAEGVPASVVPGSVSHAGVVLAICKSDSKIGLMV